MSSPIQFLPNISDILSEITDVVSSVQESPSNASHNSSEAVDLRQLLLFLTKISKFKKFLKSCLKTSLVLIEI